MTMIHPKSTKFSPTRPYTGQLPKQGARGAGGGTPGDSALTKDQRYNRSAKGKARQARYNHSKEGKLMRRLFNQTPARRLKKILAQQIRRANGR